MGFWQGLIIGVFLGANIGIVIAGLLAGSNRAACAAEEPTGWLPMDEAVMETAALPASRTRPPAIAVSPDPVEHP
jgi:hypothetical protein